MDAETRKLLLEAAAEVAALTPEELIPVPFASNRAYLCWQEESLAETGSLPSWSRARTPD